jgi:hypothetical protein
MEIPVEMAQALESGSPDVLGVEGVNGMDVGLDADGGFAIRILVADPDLPPADLPDDIGGFPVVLIRGVPTAEHSVPDRIFHPTATGGIEVGRRPPSMIPDGEFVVAGGSLGTIFRDRVNSEPLALSCAHILCGTNPFGTFASGDVIQQPAPQTDPPPTRERLGELRRWVIPQVPPLFGPGVPSGFADAAVCSVERAFASREVEEVGRVSNLASVSVGDRVKKRGPITGLTYGTVSGLFASHLVHDDHDNPIWWLLGQVQIDVDIARTPTGVWSKRGDSGSVVLNMADEVVALHWGGSPGVGYATDIFAITTALDLVLG